MSQSEREMWIEVWLDKSNALSTCVPDGALEAPTRRVVIDGEYILTSLDFRQKIEWLNNSFREGGFLSEEAPDFLAWNWSFVRDADGNLGDLDERYLERWLDGCVDDTDEALRYMTVEAYSRLFPDTGIGLYIFDRLGPEKAAAIGLEKRTVYGASDYWYVICSNRDPEKLKAELALEGIDLLL